MKVASLIIFLGASAVVLFTTNSFWYHLAKPMITISLAAYYLSSVQTRSLVILAALVFSCLGDSFLMYEAKNQLYFLAGLVSFFLAHAAYIFSYAQHRLEESHSPLAGVHRLRLAFPVVLAGTGLVLILYPALGPLRIPVILYATVLVWMVLQALFRYGYTTPESFWLVFAGALLFMISDSILAIDKFLTSVTEAGMLIMITYIAAQVLIVEGLLQHGYAEAN
jgi:uncharacterized membrane protein YhhN